MAIVNDVMEESNPGLQVYALATIHRANVNVNKDVLEKIQEDFQSLALDTIIRHTATLVESSAARMPIVEYAHGSRAHQDYDHLTQEIINRIEGQPMPPKRRKYQIESVQITLAENATVKSVMDRLMGRKVEDAPQVPDALGSSTAQGSITAQTTRSSLPAQSIESAQSRPLARTRLATLGRSVAQTGKGTQGNRPALSRQPAQTEIAPSRDYMKAAALAGGIRKGRIRMLTSANMKSW
jgi:hypothetical protein